MSLVASSIFLNFIDLKVKFSLVLLVILHIKLFTLPNLFEKGLIKCELITNLLFAHLSFKAGEIDDFNWDLTLVIFHLMQELVHTG